MIDSIIENRLFLLSIGWTTNTCGNIHIDVSLILTISQTCRGYHVKKSVQYHYHYLILLYYSYRAQSVDRLNCKTNKPAGHVQKAKLHLGITERIAYLKQSFRQWALGGIHFVPGQPMNQKLPNYFFFPFLSFSFFSFLFY